MAGNPYASAKVPDEENAAILLRAGAEAVVSARERQAARGGSHDRSIPSGGTLTRSTELRRILAANAPALELLHRAAPMTRSSFGLVDPVNEAEELNMTRIGPPRSRSRQRERSVQGEDAHSQVALGAASAPAGRAPGVARWGLAAFPDADAGSMSTMAVALERESPMVAMLIGVAAEKILLTVTSEATARPEVSPRPLQRLQRLLLDIDLRTTWRRALLVSAVGSDRRAAAVIRANPKRMAEEGLASKERLLELLFGDILAAQQREPYFDLVGVVDQPLGSNPRWADRGKARPKSAFSVFEIGHGLGTGKLGRARQSTMSVRTSPTWPLKVPGWRGCRPARTHRRWPHTPRLCARPVRRQAAHVPARVPDGSAVIAVPALPRPVEADLRCRVGLEPSPGTAPPGKAVAKK